MFTSPLQWPSKTSFAYFTNFMYLAMNMDVHPSLHIWPVDMREPDWRWGEMLSVLYLVGSSGLRWNYDLWVSCIPYGIRTWVPLYILSLLVQVFWTFMQFWLAPVSEIT